MKFSDILDLARQGYKPSDIKELLSIETEPDTKSESEQETDTKSEPEQETDMKSEPGQETDTKSEPEPDYKKMYEETLKRLDALQKANQRQPVEEHKDSVDDIIRNVFY